MEINSFEDDEHGPATMIKGTINGKDYRAVAYHDKQIIRLEGSYTTEDGTPKETLNTYEFDELDGLKDSHEEMIENVKPQIQKREDYLEDELGDLEPLDDFEQRVKDCFEKVQKHIQRDKIQEDLEQLRSQVKEQRDWKNMLEEAKDVVHGS